MFSETDYEHTLVSLLKKSPSKVMPWITIVIVSVSLFLLYAIFFEYRERKEYIGTVDSTSQTIKTWVSKVVASKLSDYQLVINREIYEYQIESVTYMDSEHYEIKIIPSSTQIKEGYITFYLQKDKTTLYKEMKRKIERMIL